MLSSLKEANILSSPFPAEIVTSVPIVIVYFFAESIFAAFDEYENKKYYQAGEYTMWDYVGKEIVKSFFSGTIAFILLIVFWGLGDIDTITKWINRVDLTTFVPKLIVAYAGFMIVYLLITARIYCARYAKGYRKMKAYGNHLKRARRLLREEK